MIELKAGEYLANGIATVRFGSGNGGRRQLETLTPVPVASARRASGW